MNTKKELIPLDPKLQSPAAQEFGEQLIQRIVGQSRAVDKLCRAYQIYLAGMNNPTRPISTLLFLGPTGSGKTRTVEAAAEVLHGDPHSIVKIDCAEFQHSHDIAKLIGSPPGYLGHRETSPILTQDNLDKSHSANKKVTFVLFDEIEKASGSLWQLLLGILDKATLTLGDNRRVDFSKCIVILTSNLGAREMSNLLSGGIGFQPVKQNTDAITDLKIYRTAIEAVKRKFSPEFFNRIDSTVVFRALQTHHILQILNLELEAVQNRITNSVGTKFIFQCTPSARAFLLDEGIDLQYGARHLKRAIERFLVYPLSNLIATDQIQTGDVVTVDCSQKTNRLEFTKVQSSMIISGASAGNPINVHY